MHSLITITVATLSALTAAVPHARNQFSHHHIRDVAAIVRRDAPIAGREVPGTFNLSPIGTCGGSSGYQCAPGFCCSTWGYCGTSDAYCGAGSSDNTTSSGGPSKSHPRPGRPHRRPHHKPPPVYSSPPSQSSPPASAAPVPSASVAPVPSAAPSGAPSAAPSGAPSAAPSAAPSSPAASSPAYSAPPAPSASAPSTGGGSWAYKMFTGDGSTSAGWPSQEQWVDFDSAFASSTANLKASCTQFGYQDDSSSEIADIKSAIQSVASESGVDSRFILAIMMQESNGCVRVQTTDNGVTNPGLMQSHDGTGTCNSGSPVSPCPASEITQMIKDGTEGTSSGDGLKQCLSQCPSAGAQAYYGAAVIYNSGNLPSNLDDNTATPCYASDVANRLMGWFSGTSSCTL